MPPPPWRLAILAPDTHAGVKLLRLARAAALCVAQNRPLRAPSAGAGAGAVCYPLNGMRGTVCVCWETLGHVVCVALAACLLRGGE